MSRPLREGEHEKRVQTPDDWYPCFPGDEVRVSVVYLRGFDGRPDGWRCCVWGADDDGMEKDFFGPDAHTQARDAYDAIQSGITHDALFARGFVRA